MYCIGCGFDLSNEAQFCPRCGKRSTLGDPVLDHPPEIETLATENIAKDEVNALESDRTTSDDSSSLAPVDLKGRTRHANAGSITLGVFGLIFFIVGAVQGFIPIFLIAGLAFGGLTWLCAVRWPLSEVLLSVVLASSLLIAGLVGVTLDRDSFGPRYRYLTQGNQQLRIDEKAGRTDRLGSNGWYPVAFDKDAQEMSDIGSLFTISLTKGQWTSTLGGQICFTASNSSSSGYIVDRITIRVKTQKPAANPPAKDSAQTKDYSMYGSNENEVVLKSYGGGLIGPGQESLVCGSSPRDLSADETWSYSGEQIYGWKR
jgi:hypothetical protein